MKMGDDRFRAHDHLTGNYRGAAHLNSKLNYNNLSFIPDFNHNLAGYDTYLFVKEFGYSQEKMRVIPNNEEKVISFSATSNDGMTYRFLDTLKY